MTIRLNVDDLRRELEPFANRVGGTVGDVFSSGLGDDGQWMIEIEVKTESRKEDE